MTSSGSPGPEPTTDRHGQPVSVGSRVRVLAIRESILQRLPPDERADLESMLGEVFDVYEVDETGQAWVRKEWPADPGLDDYRSHSLGLDPHEMACVEADEPPAS